MRVIFLALLLANLLYLGWAEWIDVPAPPPASSIAGLPRLTLVSDLPPAKRAALAKKMSLQTAAPQCVSVGPFEDPAIAAQAASLLRAKSFAPEERTAEAPSIRRFWVYLDGFKSDTTEMRALRRLERRGIDDAEAMPADAGGRKVSLGLFSDRARAESRAKAVRTMGFKPAISERMLPGTVYWLDLALPSASAPVPLKDVSDLESGGGASPIGVQPCSSEPSPIAPTHQTASPPSSPVTAPVRQTAAPASSSSSPALTLPPLPRCKPGGGGTVPCVASDPKTAARPSVL